MTISSEVRKAGPFDGNDSTTELPFAFKVFSASDLYVVIADEIGTETVLALTTDYTVTLNADQNVSPGGTVTLAAPLATGNTAVVSSKLPNLQPTDLTNQGGFYPKVVTSALDRLTILVQQLAEKLSRSLKLAISTPDGVDAQLPAPVPYALIGWNGAGDGFQNTDPTYSTALATDLSSTASGKGASLIGYLPPETGAVGRTVQGRLHDFVSVKDFGAVGDGVVDDTAALVAAVASGATSIFIPPGAYRVTSTVVLSTTRDLTFKGAGRDATAFLTTISDGSPVFKISGQWHDIGEFKISSATGNLQNFVGIQAGSQSESTSFTRSRLRIKVSNASVGVKVRGWVNDLDVFSVLSTQGFHGRELNSCTINLRTENCTQGWDVQTIYGTTIHNLLDENTFSPGTMTVTNVIDDFQGLTINSMYVEAGSYSTTVASFAPTTASSGLVIGQIQSVVSPEDRTDAVWFDKVTGLEISGKVAAGGYHGSIGFSANARAIAPFVSCPPGSSTGPNSTYRLHDNSKQIRKAQNWFGDTYLDHGFNTFDVVTKTGVVTSIETANIYTGKKAIKIEASTGGASRLLSLRRTVNIFPLVANLVGKTVKMFAWIYVPDLPKFKDRTYIPAIEVSVSGGASAFSATQQTMLHGCWNLVETPAITVPAGWTGATSDRVDFTFYVNSTGTSVSDSGYYIVVDSIFVTDGNVSILDIQRGNVEEYPLMGIRSDGHNMFIKSANYSAITNADSSTTLGDQVVFTSPTVGGFIGRVCTTAGALGSTAIFKTFGAISA